MRPMSTVDATELRPGLKLLIDGQPYVVIERQFVKPGKGAAFTRTKMKNLLTGRNIESNIRSGEKIEPADVEDKEMTFLYKEGEDFVFMDSETFDQFTLSNELVGELMLYLKENDKAHVVMYEGKALSLDLPATVELKVTETEPALKGATAAAQFKPATLETGLKITVPPFVGVGEMISIDTRTGEYLSRAK